MEEDTYQMLLTASFRFLSFRPRSMGEISDFLQKKTHLMYVNPSVLKRVMDRLVDLGYIDDAKFAAWWIGARQKTKPKGQRLILLELKKKGITPEIIETILGGGQSGGNRDEIEHIPEEELAVRAIHKKRELWKRLPKVEQKKKIYDFLGRRGFASATIFRVIDSVIGKGYNNDEVE